MISTESKFLSIHRIKYDIVTMTFKVIQSQRSWCLIKESTHVHIYEILAIVCLIATFQRYLMFACYFAYGLLGPSELILGNWMAKGGKLIP